MFREIEKWTCQNDGIEIYFSNMDHTGAYEDGERKQLHLREGIPFPTKRGTMEEVDVERYQEQMF